METIDIEISKGTVTLKKPTAGERNAALIKAETTTGLKHSLFAIELLPKMIVSHPFGAEPLRQALDDLSCDEYDLLFAAQTKLLKGKKDGDIEKKSEEPSSPKDSQSKDGSKPNS